MAVSLPVSVTDLFPGANVTVTPLGAATLFRSSVPYWADSVSVIGRGLLLPSTALATAPNWLKSALLKARRVPMLVDCAPGFSSVG